MYELFKRRFNEEEARTVIEYFEMKADPKLAEKKDLFLTKDDKIDIIRSIYLANVFHSLRSLQA